MANEPLPDAPEPRAYLGDDETIKRLVDGGQEARIAILKRADRITYHMAKFYEGEGAESARARGITKDVYCDSAWEGLRLGLMAETIVIGEQMGEMVSYMETTFKPEPILKSDLLVPDGFALFPQSMVGPDGAKDIEGREGFAFNALAWHSDEDLDGKPIVQLTALGNAEMDGDQKIAQLIREQGGRPEDWWVPTMYIPMAMELSGQDPALADADEWHPHYRFARHTFQVFHHLCTQKYVSHARNGGSRANRRRAVRGGVPIDKTQLRVVILRHRDSRPPKGDEEPVEWQCCWFSRPHWRDQPYPKLGITKQKWIVGSIKGDLTKPFKPPRERGFALVR